METPEDFLKHYHNNLPNDWLFEKREVVARLIKEYEEQALHFVGKSEQLPCDECVSCQRELFIAMRLSDNENNLAYFLERLYEAKKI